MKIIEYIRTKEEFAKNLRLIRKHRGLSQQNVADKLHVDHSTYTYYETSKTEPNLLLLIKLCEIYDIEITDLITKEGLRQVRINMNSGRSCQ